ncbi:MAG TPA: hypothetical protein VES40_21205 [Ilumatobacteraceae bacterium]|nr:hypothetical protein [Ilumatobacteraceae bacterium]
MIDDPDEAVPSVFDMELTRGDGRLRIEMGDDGVVHVDHLDRLVRWRGCSNCLDLWSQSVHRSRPGCQERDPLSIRWIPSNVEQIDTHNPEPADRLTAASRPKSHVP